MNVVQNAQKLLRIVAFWRSILCGVHEVLLLKSGFDTEKQRKQLHPSRPIKKELNQEENSRYEKQEGTKIAGDMLCENKALTTKKEL